MSCGGPNPREVKEADRYPQSRSDLDRLARNLKPGKAVKRTTWDSLDALPRLAPDSGCEKGGHRALPINTLLV